jgi:hypothetical protein
MLFARCVQGNYDIHIFIFIQMPTFYNERELLNCKDEELTKILMPYQDIDEHNVYQLDIYWDGESDYTELLEFHATDHFEVFGKYQIWAEIRALIVDRHPETGMTRSLDKTRYSISIIFQF